MPDLTAKRTLVKSPPELWEELSEVDRLAKHLGAFGEITITKLEPEHTVAWEGERASGTVSIEPSGWGTKVTLRAELPDAAPEREPEQAAPADAGDEAGAPAREPDPVAQGQEPEPEPAARPDAAAPAEEAQHVDDHIRRFRVEPEPVPEEEPRRGFWGWLFRRRTEPVAMAPVPAEPEPVAAEPAPQPVAAEPAPEPLVAEPEAAPEPEPVAAEPAPEPLAAEPEPTEPALDPEQARVILDEALDALGAAHHRPFSRG